jgi:hypothetical protein
MKLIGFKRKYIRPVLVNVDLSLIFACGKERVPPEANPRFLGKLATHQFLLGSRYCSTGEDIVTSWIAEPYKRSFSPGANTLAFFCKSRG